MRKSIILSMAVLFFVMSPLLAAVRTVPDQFNTIQSAIFFSNDGDIVVVSPGTYNEHINFLGKKITVTSTDPNDWEVVKATIIDGSNSGSVVTFANGETNESVLKGFTITKGYGSLNPMENDSVFWGGGIYCESSSPMIMNNIITQNNGPGDMSSEIGSYGGGIGCSNSNAIISNNIIKNNSAAAGGGLLFIGGNSTITNNVISNNRASIGGGVVLLGGALVNNTINNNGTGSSGGEAGSIYVAFQPGGYESKMINNIICNANSGGGILFYNFYGNDFDISDMISHNNVWGNVPFNYYDLINDIELGFTGVSGNISQNPLFTDEYHIGTDSPCYNAGDPSYLPYPWQRDIDGEYAVMNDSPDIGADEISGNARPVANAGDDQHEYTLVSNVILDGTGSYDPDNSGTLTYQWSQIKGQNVVLSNADTAEPNFAPPLEGLYEFALTVYDGDIYSASDSVIIMIGNNIPVANAGDDQYCQIGDQVYLNGSDSNDLDETDTLSYTWTQVSGPQVELINANTPNPIFVAPQEGSYVFSLVVSDGYDSSQPDTVTVICTIGSYPDSYGYSWIDSDNPWGPAYHWIDIQETGTMVGGVEYSYVESFGPFSLGFDFNFYGNTYDYFYVQSEGLISFTSTPVSTSYYPIPYDEGYNNIIAWMWTYHYPQRGSKVYYQAFDDYCVIQFVDYSISGSTSSTVDAEVILYKSGEIVIQYKEFSNGNSSCTIGIENADGTIGSQVGYGSDYNLHNELAIEFSTGGPYKPVAKAQDEQLFEDVELITLDGSASYDRDPNDVLTYQWTQTSGPSVELSDPTSPITTFMPTEKGVYTFELVVNDGAFSSFPKEVLIVIGNRPPVANAGTDRFCQAGEQVILDGSESYDLDENSVLTYSWTQISGPNVELSNPNNEKASFVPTTLGEYVFQLVVNDGEDSSQPDTIKITCKIGSEPDAYGYTWIDSDNPYGPAYYWEDISNARHHIRDIEGGSGRVLGSITMSFDFNFYGKTYKKIYVQSSGVLSFGPDSIYYNESIPYPDGYENMIAWMRTEMELTKNSVVHYKEFNKEKMVIQFENWTTYGDYGTINAQVILYKSGKIVFLYKDATINGRWSSYTIGIENSDGTIGTQVAHRQSGYLHDELAIEFSTGSGPYEPVARAGSDQVHKVIKQITLDGSNSNDRDPNYVLTYQWSQVSGPSVVLSNPTAAITTFTPPSEGEYIFELVVNDGTYTSYPDQVRVYIGNQEPIAEAGDDIVAEPGQEVTLNGSGSYDLDEDDSIASYSWTQISGPSVTINNSDSVNATFTTSMIGQYVFQLVVSDGVSTSQPDTVTVFCTYGSLPDNYGYSWVDSDSVAGPTYNWIDIQDTGTHLSGIRNADDEVFGPFSLGFNFNFYGNVYNRFYIQSNGAISFGPDYMTLSNKTIPKADIYNNIIVWYWADFYIGDGAEIYYQNFDDCLVIQFVDYTLLGSDEYVNAEIILYKSGKIIIQYKDFSPDFYLGRHTVGIENEDGTDGLQVSYNNSSYLHNELAIEFSFGPPYIPIAEAGANQYIRTLEQVTLDGSGSSDRDPLEILTYQWTQLTGPPVTLSDSSAMNPTFLPPVENEYKFKLEVSNSGKTSEPDYVTIFVGNETPIADAGPDIIVNIPSTVNLYGGFSHDYDLNDVLTYSWTQIGGPTVALDNSESESPSFYCDQEGIYEFSVIVNDGLETSSPDTVVVKTAQSKSGQQIIDLGYGISDYFYYPSFSGDKLVYSYGTESDYSWDIYYDNLTTGSLYSFAAGGIDTHPKIDGDIVVWFGGTNFNDPWSNEPHNSSVIARNLSTGVQRTLKGYSMSSSYSHPVVSGKKVVWIEHQNLNTTPIGSNNAANWWNSTYSICGADVSSMSYPNYFTVASNVGTRDPYPVDNFASDFDDVIDIDNDIVVYEANGDIYGADISDLGNIRVFTICSNPFRQFDPAISGNIVVWTDQRNDLGDIYGADISDIDNIRSFIVVKAQGTQEQPDIDGRYMVYVDGDNGNGNIKASFIAGQSALDIPLTGTLYGSAPVIEGQMIIWQTSTHEQLEALSIEFMYTTIDGPVENTTSGKKYDYIQHAIDDSNDGDIIVVEPGIYCENIDTHGKNLVIRSSDSDDSSIVESTILKALDNDIAVVTYSDGQDVNCVLEGFTITDSAIGIYCEEFSSPTISKCNIVDNSMYGIYLYRGCEPLITECKIMNNGDTGIKMSTTNEDYNKPVITNCVICGNAIVGISGGQPEIINCTIADNSLCGLYNCNAAISNTIIYFNGNQVIGAVESINYSNLSGVWSGMGNIVSDPLFADSQNGDYHLKSEAGRWSEVSQSWIQDSSSSPCIDAGDPSSSVGEEPAPNGSIINIGAYGGTSQASMSN